MIYPLKNQCNEEEPKPSQEENRKTEKPVSDGVNPEKPDVPLNKNDAFQKVQKRRVQEKR